jgi:ABC-type sugar transport system substrate-binding protein
MLRRVQSPTATDYPNVKVDVKGATSETAYDEQQNMIETDLNADGYDGFVIAPLQADLAS